MNHIELAISVLREEIRNLQYSLKYDNLLPETYDETMEKIQKLHRAVNDISNLIKD